MSEQTKIVSKVLVHEFEAISLTLLKDVCIENNLVGLRVCSGQKSVGIAAVSDEFHEVLRSNLDLGAIFLTEAADQNGVTGLDLCVSIHRTRPELPIFLRRVTARELSDEVKQSIAGCYENNNIQQLHDLVSEYLSGMYYPLELAQGIQDITVKVFEDLIEGVRVRRDNPHLVKDQLIYGELFSLIPLESDWCRGYMMLQTTENEMIDLLRSEKTTIKTKRPSRGDINSILGEATNLIWGKVKSCYFTNVDTMVSNKIHVPIITNHAQRHISFGSIEPQLCFKYVLKDPEHQFASVIIHQRLIFNLVWAPEKFAENDKIVEHLVEGGDLEVF